MPAWRASCRIAASGLAILPSTSCGIGCGGETVSPPIVLAVVKAVLTPWRHFPGMVARKRLRSALSALCLYVAVAGLIGYFYVNAYSGNNGLRAKQGLDMQIAQLTIELNTLKAERMVWERRVALLKPENLDPDMLEERARALL